MQSQLDRQVAGAGVLVSKTRGAPAGHEDARPCTRPGPIRFLGATRSQPSPPDHPLAKALEKPTINEIEGVQRRNAGSMSTSGEPIWRRPRKSGFDTGHQGRATRSRPTRTLPLFIANFVLMDYGTGRDLSAARRMTSATSWISRKPVRAGYRHRCLRREATGARAVDGRRLRAAEDRRRCAGSHRFPERWHGPEIMPPAPKQSTTTIAKWAEAGRCIGSGHGEVPPARLGDQRASATGAVPIPVIHCPTAAGCGAGTETRPARCACPRTWSFDRPGQPAGSGIRRLVSQVRLPEMWEGPARRETDTMDTFVDSVPGTIARFCSPRRPIRIDPDSARRHRLLDERRSIYWRGGACNPPPVVFSRFFCPSHGMQPNHLPREAQVSLSTRCSPKAW